MNNSFKFIHAGIKNKKVAIFSSDDEDEISLKNEFEGLILNMFGYDLALAKDVWTAMMTKPKNCVKPLMKLSEVISLDWKLIREKPNIIEKATDKICDLCATNGIELAYKTINFIE